MYQNWAFNSDDGVYTATHSVHAKLPPGLYSLGTNGWNQPTATRKDLRKDVVVRFQHGPLVPVLAEIKTFWGAAAHYRSLGVSHKRGILLHGPAGCGKTGIVSAIVESSIADGGLALTIANNIGDFTTGLKGLWGIDAGRPVVLVMEDLDSIVTDNVEAAVLEMLDGASSVGDGMLVLATTNKLDEIPKRIRCRPSRIDTLVEVGLPSIHQRLEYLKFLLRRMPASGFRSPTDDEEVIARLLVNLAEKSHNFSLAMVKELVVSVVVYGASLDQAAVRIKEMADE